MNKKVNKKEVGFETTVLDYLSRHSYYARREQLIEDLMNEHPDERGYKPQSIGRKLTNMKKANLISIEKDSEVLKKYGIEKEAKNASYILSKDITGIKTHLDSIFSLLKPEDDIDKQKVLNKIKGYELTEDDIAINAILKEIKRYNIRYRLNPKQLDILVSRLDSQDNSSINDLIQILYDHIIDKGIKPEDKDNFLEKLTDILEKDPEIHKEYPELKRRVINLLGYYNHKAVVEQLKKDIELGKLSTFQEYYEEKYTARIIEEERTELFYLENQLRKKGDIKTADILSQIRNKAAKYVEWPIESD